VIHKSIGYQRNATEVPTGLSNFRRACQDAESSTTPRGIAATSARAGGDARSGRVGRGAISARPALFRWPNFTDFLGGFSTKQLGGDAAFRRQKSSSRGCAGLNFSRSSAFFGLVVLAAVGAEFAPVRHLVLAG
jgi:hypothetical protein